MGSFFALSPKILFGIPHFWEYDKFRLLSECMQTARHHFYGIEQHAGSYVLGMFLGYLVRYKPNLYFGGRIGESIIWIMTTIITICHNLKAFPLEKLVYKIFKYGQKYII